MCSRPCSRLPRAVGSHAQGPQQADVFRPRRLLIAGLRAMVSRQSSLHQVPVRRAGMSSVHEGPGRQDLCGGAEAEPPSGLPIFSPQVAPFACARTHDKGMGRCRVTPYRGAEVHMQVVQRREESNGGAESHACDVSVQSGRMENGGYRSTWNPGCTSPRAGDRSMRWAFSFAGPSSSAERALILGRAVRDIAPRVCGDGRVLLTDIGDFAGLPAWIPVEGLVLCSRATGVQASTVARPG
jgi:hypothetical protein